jgi:hypothetical protein
MGDVTLIVEMKLSPGLREVKPYGDLSKIFTDLLTVIEYSEAVKFRNCICTVPFSFLNFVISCSKEYPSLPQFLKLNLLKYINVHSNHLFIHLSK